MPRPEPGELSAPARILRANIRVGLDKDKVRCGLTDDEFVAASDELLRLIEQGDSDDKDEKIILFLEIIKSAL